MAPPQALLFAPPRPPLRVEDGAEVVMGRSSTCDLPLPSAEASRRHAAVTCRGGACVVRDLGSTNGTFVNGAPLDAARALRAGDRIEIGGVTITYCEVEGALADVGATGDQSRTVIAERAPAAGGAALDGSLDEIPTFAVLQMLEMGGKSGCLEVEHEDGVSRLWLGNGRPIHAEGPKRFGVEAALHLVAIERGRFRFEAVPPPSERTIDAAVTELLLEASRLSDEAC